MGTNLTPNKEHLADKALRALQGRYVLVGRRRVISWHAWLLVGIVVGAIVGILWVANRTSEFSKSEAATAVGEPQILLSGMSSIYSPTVYEWQGTKRMLMGGFLTPTDANDFLAVVAACGGVAQTSTCEALNNVVGADKIFYSEFTSGQWTPPVLVFSKIGYHVNDPTVVKPPSSPGVDRSNWLYMYYTALENRFAASPVDQTTHNLTGFASSVDGGKTWTDIGIVVGQNNGLDDKGAWSPSAIVVGNEIWLYYHTNEGAPKVYRTKLALNGWGVLGPPEVMLEDITSQPLTFLMNVDVSKLGQKYVLITNTNVFSELGNVYRYVSNDGRVWRVDPLDENRVLINGGDARFWGPHAESIDDQNFHVYFGFAPSATAAADSIRKWTFNVSAPFGSIQGFQIGEDGQPSSIPEGATITLDGRTPPLLFNSDNIYSTGITVPSGFHTLVSNVPSGYRVWYTTQPPANYLLQVAEGVTVQLEPGTAVNLWWKYEPFTFIQGAFVDGAGSPTAAPPDAVLMLDGAPIIHNATGYSTDFVARRNHTITAGIPSGFKVSYSFNPTSGIYQAYHAGDVVPITLPSSNTSDGHVELWWKYEPLSLVVPQTFQASVGFSNTQGQNGWKYMTARPGANTFAGDLTFNSSRGVWVLSSKLPLFIGSAQVSPANRNDAIRRWVAPSAGSADISAIVSDANTACGDGVVVSVKKGAQTLWEPSTLANNGASLSFNLTGIPLAANEAIDFIVNRGPSNDRCDATNFDPRIVFTAAE